MTPLECAKSLAEYLKKSLTDYDETGDIPGEEGYIPGTLKTHDSQIKIYAGFLPRARTKKELQVFCPAIVLRPELVDDGKESTKVSMVAYVTVYDEDLERGCDQLYHILEFVRYMLLANNPVNNQWQIDNGLKTTIPDDQPFPQWLGVIEFDVYLQQPTWTPLNVWRD